MIKIHSMRRFELSHGTPAYFFKAQRLRPSDTTESRLLGALRQTQHAGAERMTANWLQTDLTNLIVGGN